MRRKTYFEQIPVAKVKKDAAEVAEASEAQEQHAITVPQEPRAKTVGRITVGSAGAKKNAPRRSL